MQYLPTDCKREFEIFFNFFFIQHKNSIFIYSSDLTLLSIDLLRFLMSKIIVRLESISDRLLEK